MLRQSAEVVAAVPIFISSPLYRRWHLRWGATDEEVAEPMPGDELVPVAHFVATRAVTICAPPSAVWPWIMQVGFGRAGFYSYDLLDNLGRPSAEDLHMEWQQAHVGDLAAPMTNPPTTDTSFSVHDVKSTEYVVWSKPGSTWVWMLKPLDATRTRLVTRIRQRYVPRPATVVTIILSEFGDFAMMRKMLLGIKRRAERYPAPSGPGSSGVPTSPVPESGLRQSGVDAPAGIQVRVRKPILRSCNWPAMVRTSLTDRLRSSSTSSGRRAVLLGSRRSRLGCHALGRHLVGPGRLSGERAWHHRFAG